MMDDELVTAMRKSMEVFMRRSMRRWYLTTSISNARLSIPEIPAENFSIEWWETRTGKILQQAQVKSLTDLTIPNFSSDIACKIRMK